MTLLSEHLSSVIRILDKSPLIQEATVFGSLVDRPASAGDVDIAFVIDAPFSSTTLDRYRHLLKGGAYGTPRYGLLDIFLCFSDQTWVRNADCLGFTRAKNAAAIRQAIAQKGQPWEPWRSNVSLHADSTIYFAHPINAYDTALETQAIRALRQAGFTVVNPSDAEHQATCGNDMNRWTALAGSCDAIAFLPFEDGAIGAGVAQEVDTVHKQGKPVFKLTLDGRTLMPMAQWPGNEEVLSVEDTRARLHPFRQARQEAGLAPAPVRSLTGMKPPRP